MFLKLGTGRKYHQLHEMLGEALFRIAYQRFAQPAKLVEIGDNNAEAMITSTLLTNLLNRHAIRPIKADCYKEDPL
ncbi:hypothetical protein [Candidatus Methylomirabilis sp.]|uniref:hypothetical protein n=1 Tax=Candidatus Methylomirabilis sp. TaxID=2032687 RepID=UPI003C7899D1